MIKSLTNAVNKHRNMVKEYSKRWKWNRVLIDLIFAWNVPLVSLIFLNRSLVFPILLFSSISLHCSLKKSFLTSSCYFLGFCIQMVVSFLLSLPFASLHFSAICKASSDNYFALLHFFFLGMVWSRPPIPCYEPPSIVFWQECQWSTVLGRVPSMKLIFEKASK